jgi:hypothetical protein
MLPQLRGIGPGIANRIDFFLQGKEYVCRRVQAGEPDICLLLILHHLYRTRHGGTVSWSSKRFKRSLGLGMFLFPSVIVILGPLSWIFRVRTATNLANAGAASVSDLSRPQYASLLTPTQKVGVLYGDHMTRPIPRAEAEEIAVRANPCLIPHNAYHCERPSFATTSPATLKYT